MLGTCDDTSILQLSNTWGRQETNNLQLKLKATYTLLDLGFVVDIEFFDIWHSPAENAPL